MHVGRAAVRHILLAIVATVVLVGAGAPPPGATASGCQGKAASFTVGEDSLGSAAAPGRGGTMSDPFDVVWDGDIAWSGSTGAPVQNGTWSVSLAPVGGGVAARGFAWAVSTLASGDVGNESAKTSTSGTSRLSDYVPVRAMTGIYEVSWDVSDARTSCTGSAVINITGNPLTTPMFFIALLMFLLGGYVLLALTRLLVSTA